MQPGDRVTVEASRGNENHTFTGNIKSYNDYAEHKEHKEHKEYKDYKEHKADKDDKHWEADKDDYEETSSEKKRL